MNNIVNTTRIIRAIAVIAVAGALATTAKAQCTITMSGVDQQVIDGYGFSIQEIEKGPSLPGVETFEHPASSVIARQGDQESVPGERRALDPDGEARDALEGNEISHLVQRIERRLPAQGADEGVRELRASETESPVTVSVMSDAEAVLMAHPFRRSGPAPAARPCPRPPPA